MVLRQKLSVRVAAATWLALAVLWLTYERTPQAVVNLVVAMVWVVCSFRALILLREDVVYRRGLLGWDKRPLPLDELTAVSLRREAQFRYIALVLRLSGPEGSEVSIECWAWERWPELAHRAGHFARHLDARRDDVTDGRMACSRVGCQWESRVAATVGDRRAGPPPDDDLANMGFLESLGVVAVLFAFGFALGLFNGWFRDDLELGPLLPFAIGCGGFFAIGGCFVVAWEKAKGKPTADRQP